MNEEFVTTLGVGQERAKSLSSLRSLSMITMHIRRDLAARSPKIPNLLWLWQIPKNEPRKRPIAETAIGMQIFFVPLVLKS